MKHNFPAPSPASSPDRKSHCFALAVRPAAQAQDKSRAKPAPAHTVSLLVSDIHFEPSGTRTRCQAQRRDCRQVAPSSTARRLAANNSTHSCRNAAAERRHSSVLFDASLKAMKEQCLRRGLCHVSGDLIPISSRKNTSRPFPGQRPELTTPSSKRRFSMWSTSSCSIPKALVYVALGNNDSDATTI